MNKRDQEDYERLRLEGMQNHLAPGDAHLADSAGPSVEERINPGPDEIVPKEWADEQERRDRMIGTTILIGIAGTIGLFIGRCSV